MNSDIRKLVSSKKYYEDLYEIPWILQEGKPLVKKNKVRIGLINVPCGGFGDIIVCHTFYEYLKEWYPQHQVVICTTALDKFKKLGIRTTSFVEILSKGGDECEPYNLLYFKKQPKPFDMMICVPIINEQFNINHFQKLIPYANLFNTFTMSEYNGYIPPYTFPIGVGKGQLGMFITKPTIKPHGLLKKPYALVYIAESPPLIHSRMCFLSYMEMICKKYSKKHPFFQVVVPPWVIGELSQSRDFKHKLKKLITPYYPNVLMTSDQDELHFFERPGNSLLIRGDILPKPRPVFISLIKDSVEDVLLTGDQSLTDGLSCCSKTKKIWYQIAPWKTDLAKALGHTIPNKYIDNFKTSCGTLQGLLTSIDYSSLLRQYDFRKLGKGRMDQLVNFHYLKDEFKDYMDIVLHSRTIPSVLKKLDKLKYNV